MRASGRDFLEARYAMGKPALFLSDAPVAHEACKICRQPFSGTRGQVNCAGCKKEAQRRANERGYRKLQRRRQAARLLGAAVVLLAVSLGLAQTTTWTPVGDTFTVLIDHEERSYWVSWRKLRGNCTSHQANDCESRAARAVVDVVRFDRYGKSPWVTFVGRQQHRICETKECGMDEPAQTWLEAALAQEGKR